MIEDKRNTMRISLELVNYCCFFAESPGTITLGDGFTALVGTNNSGKSTLLRFFFEFRSFFTSTSIDTNFAKACENGGPCGSFSPLGVKESVEIYNHNNNDAITIKISIQK